MDNARKTEGDPSHGKRIAWNWMFRKFKNHILLHLPSLSAEKESIGARTTSIEQESLRPNLMHLDAVWKMCLKRGWVHAESDRLSQHPVTNSSTYDAGV